MLLPTNVLVLKKATPEPIQVRYSMSDPSYHLSSSDNGPFGGGQPKMEEPQFGVIDIVEAFTAMRHEWRGQTKESRQLAEQIQAAVATLQDIKMKLLDRAPPSHGLLTDPLPTKMPGDLPN